MHEVAQAAVASTIASAATPKTPMEYYVFAILLAGLCLFLGIAALFFWYKLRLGIKELEAPGYSQFSTHENSGVYLDQILKSHLAGVDTLMNTKMDIFKKEVKASMDSSIDELRSVLAAADVVKEKHLDERFCALSKQLDDHVKATAIPA